MSISGIRQPRPLSPGIQTRLVQFVRRQRACDAIRSLLLAISIVATWLLIVGLFDRVLHLPGAVRAVSLLGLSATVLAMVRRPVARLLRRDVDWILAAELYERAARMPPQLLSTVVSATLAEDHSGRILNELTRRAETALASAPAARPAGQRVRLRRVGLIAVLAVAVLVIAGRWPELQLSRLVRRQLMPLAAIAPATTTQITVMTDASPVADGDDLLIVAHVSPAPRGGVMLRLWDQTRQLGQVGMTPGSNDTYTYRVSPVLPGMQYKLVAGDASSGPHTVVTAVARSTGRSAEADDSAVRHPDTVGEALGAIRRADELLAQLPQQLARVEEAARWARQAQEQAETSRRNARLLPPWETARAERAADAADHQAEEAFEWLAELAQPLPAGPDAGVMLELADLAEQLNRQGQSVRLDLGAALAKVRRAIASRDPGAAETAAREATAASSDAQDSLRATRRRIGTLQQARATTGPAAPAFRQDAINAFSRAREQARSGQPPK